MAMYDDGYARGLQWATHAAADDELRNLQSLRDGKSTEVWNAWFLGSQDGDPAIPPAFKRLVSVMRPDGSGQPNEIAAFWRAAVTFDASLPQRVVQDPDFVLGFADGALEAWKEAGGAGERGSEVPDENWIDEENGPSTANDT